MLQLVLWIFIVVLVVTKVFLSYITIGYPEP
jgi:hypothetical protein